MFIEGVKNINVKFSWGSGWMEIEAEKVVEYMSMKGYKKWATLFAKYGTPEQHKEFLQFVSSYIGTKEAEGVSNTKLKRYKTIYQVLEGLVS